MNKSQVNFLLNDQLVQTDTPSNSILLDFIRYNQSLKGTTTACREGDCGACAVLLGQQCDTGLHYRTITSCLLPLGDAQGHHVVTIEGLAMNELNPIQQAIAEFGGTQCGFCTPGFVISLTTFFLTSSSLNLEQAIEAINGNICRCTGYKSIERAATALCEKYKGLGSVLTNERLNALVDANVLPSYFAEIPKRLRELRKNHPKPVSTSVKEQVIPVGGGTDLYVQRPEKMQQSELLFVFQQASLKGISRQNGSIYLGAATTMQQMADDTSLQEQFVELKDYFKLIASRPIREQASIGGNLINASPIGDLTIFFLALEAKVTLCKGETLREIPLKQFYLDYKKIDKLPDELLKEISFSSLTESSYFNFEKVSKRTHLDIASVNSAALLECDGETILHASFSAGGVSPIPLHLSETSKALKGKPISAESAILATKIAAEEISPISDARGSEQYKRLLLRQLIFAHFLKCFPKRIKLEDLL